MEKIKIFLIKLFYLTTCFNFKLLKTLKLQSLLILRIKSVYYLPNLQSLAFKVKPIGHVTIKPNGQITMTEDSLTSFFSTNKHVNMHLHDKLPQFI